MFALPIGLSPLLASAAAPVACSALLIGNSSYQRNAALPNAGSDVRLLARALQGAGFEVDVQVDLTQRQLDAGLRRFFDRVERRPGSAAWVSFAGHGVQLDGKNYLQGIDSDFSSPEQVRRFGQDLDELLFLLGQARPAAAVVSLDTCRNNPFKPQVTRGAVAGLAPTEAAGMLVGFSTAAYMPALDGPANATSPYARALADALARRPTTLEQVFRETADTVYRFTGKRQVPEYRSSLRSEWTFSKTGVDLRPLEGLSAALPASTPGSARGVRYRPDLILPAAASVAPAEWDAEVARLQARAGQADTRMARLWVARGRAANATPFDSTLAGLLLDEGRAIPRDRLAAIDSYQRAAVRGNAVAQMLLGELHFQLADYPAAYKWLSAAANSGLPRAQMDLAQLQWEGRGGPRDVAAASENFIRSIRPPVPSAEAEALARDLARALRASGSASGR